MLTRLSVQGFKNLSDIEVRFGPFTCITGKNATGKSNLFDAIQFLQLLTQHPIMEAVRRLRSNEHPASSPGAPSSLPEPRSLFTTLGTYRAPEMRFSADLLVERDVQDEFGVAAQAAISSVRYEVAFRLNDQEKPERLELSHESLLPRTLDSARRELGFHAKPAFKTSAVTGRRLRPFISTNLDTGKPQIQVHQEGHGGREVPAPKSSWTVVGGMKSSDFPTLLAAHREMQSWKTLMLEPSAMRAPSTYGDLYGTAPFVSGRGANLPAAIERLRRAETREGEVYSELANRLAELIDDVRAVRVRDDEATETLTLEVQGRDGIFRPARSLSDGTLRFLVLATLSLDPETRGIISLEEPENGIHPERIPVMLDLLRDVAVDPELPVGDDNPLRQVLVNTHSPLVVRNVEKKDLVYIRTRKVFHGDSRASTAVVTAPAESWRAGTQDAPPATAPGEMQPYEPPQRSLPFAS